MRIVMFTNTYVPMVGGVSHSVQRFTEAYRRRGHEVLVVAPVFEDAPRHEEGVVRVPAIQHFNGSDFSMAVPIPGILRRAVRRFAPDVIHAHHPFLLGETAVRFAETLDVPLVFTHHTLYEAYTHYFYWRSERIERFIADLATGYANLCDAVIAPSESVRELIAARGVTTPVEVIPTGVDTARFAAGDGQRWRERLGIPGEAFVVGHVGRLAREKNLGFVSRALGRFLYDHPDAHAVIAGEGPAEDALRRLIGRSAIAGRVHFTGPVTGDRLVDLFHALDAFAFASHTETQGMVLIEALAAGVPVVAVDASGVREVMQGDAPGRLLARDDTAAFARALAELAALTGPERAALRERARERAARFDMERCANAALTLYAALAGHPHRGPPFRRSPWLRIRARLEAEWNIWLNRGEAVRAALRRRTGPGRRFPRLTWRRDGTATRSAGADTDSGHD